MNQLRRMGGVSFKIGNKKSIFGLGSYQGVYLYYCKVL